MLYIYRQLYLEVKNQSPSPASRSCIILAFHPSPCMALSAGQLKREIHTRSMLLINFPSISMSLQSSRKMSVNLTN